MISHLAVVESRQIGQGVQIAEFAVIREDVSIGEGSFIHSHVFVGSGTVIGEGVEIFPGTVIGKEPKGAGAVTRTIQAERRVIVGKGCCIGPNAVIYYDVEIGEDTLVGDGASIREQSRIGNRCLISRCVTLNYAVKIGDRTKVMDLTHLTGKMIIGNDVFISTGVYTANDNAPGRRGYREDRIRGPKVEAKAMVGAGAVLLPGVVVGEDAVVGAGAVVTKDVPCSTLVLGVPAQVVRRFDVSS